MQFQVGSGTPSEERAYALMSQVHQQACRQFRIGRHWCSWVLLFVANEGACAASKVHQQACSTVCGMGGAVGYVRVQAAINQLTGWPADQLLKLWTGEAWPHTISFNLICSCCAQQIPFPPHLPPPTLWA